MEVITPNTIFDEWQLLARVQEFVRTERLWTAGARLLIAVSGGADSVALFDMLHRVCDPEERIHLLVGHVHHGLRAAAEADAAFVARLASEYGIPYLRQDVDVRRRVAETGESVETAARALRYAALQDIAREVRADTIVTAHTADDQAETVLMRLLRGTGLTGLAGIPARRGNIVRPLLPVWRSEIEAYLHGRNLSFRTDESNLSTEYTRNRVRLELLPYLEAHYAPRLRERLGQLAGLARQDDQALDALAAEIFLTAREEVPDGLALSPTPRQPLALQWRVWRRAIAAVRGNLEGIHYAHIADIARLRPEAAVDLPGLRVRHEAGRLVFLLAGAEASAVAIPAQPLPVPGRLCFPQAGCCLTSEATDLPLPLGGGDCAVLNADVLRGPLTVRCWQPGDRFHPLGAPGSRKVQDIYVDARVPRRLRERVPLVLDAEEIIWIAGFRPADRVKIQAATTHRLRITVIWEYNPWTSKHSPLVP